MSQALELAPQQDLENPISRHAATDIEGNILTTDALSAPEHASYREYSAAQARIAGTAIIESVTAAGQGVTESLHNRYDDAKNNYHTAVSAVVEVKDAALERGRNGVAGFRGFLKQRGEAARAKRDNIVSRARARVSGAAHRVSETFTRTSASAVEAGKSTARITKYGATVLAGAGIIAGESIYSQGQQAAGAITEKAVTVATRTSEKALEKKQAFTSALHGAVESAKTSVTETASNVRENFADAKASVQEDLNTARSTFHKFQTVRDLNKSSKITEKHERKISRLEARIVNRGHAAALAAGVEAPDMEVTPVNNVIPLEQASAEADPIPAHA